MARDPSVIEKELTCIDDQKMVVCVAYDLADLMLKRRRMNVEDFWRSG
jgi:hypothetical protein